MTWCDSKQTPYCKVLQSLLMSHFDDPIVCNEYCIWPSIGETWLGSSVHGQSTTSERESCSLTTSKLKDLLKILGVDYYKKVVLKDQLLS